MASSTTCALYRALHGTVRAGSMFLFGDWVLCSPGWPEMSCVLEDDLECLSSHLHLSGGGIQAWITHCLAYEVLGIRP